MIIETNNLKFKYNSLDNVALNNVSFNINKGECVVLCGKSGCGKTTLTRIINGLAPSFFKGEIGGTCKVLKLEANKSVIEEYVPYVGSVFQNPKTQYFNTNTTAELVFPCENTGMARQDIKERLKWCIEYFKIANLTDRNIFKLSGGEKQKVSFATSMMLKPKILVLDEPTSNLDDQTINEIKKMLIDIKKSGVTIILAEHRLAWSLDFADKYFYFENGEIKNIYTNEEFRELNDDYLKSKGLRSIDLAPYKKIIEDKIKIDSIKPCLHISDMDIGYNSKTIYNIKNFSIAKGEILGLMGHNGIGKSTLIKTLCGLLKPIKGDIFLDDKKVNKKELIKNSFLVMQDVNYQLFSDSVKEEILLNDDDNDDKYLEILKELNLLDLIDRHPMSLSGGQRQRVAIACAINSNKDIIYLDEPTSGLDRFHMEKVGNLLLELKKLNKAVVVITHDEELAANVCDRIVRLS